MDRIRAARIFDSPEDAERDLVAHYAAMTCDERVAATFALMRRFGGWDEHPLERIARFVDPATGEESPPEDPADDPSSPGLEGGMKTPPGEPSGDPILDPLLACILERMEVVGSDGVHVGTVDHVEAGGIKLTRADSADGQHHWLKARHVARVDERVHLKLTAAEARAAAYVVE